MEWWALQEEEELLASERPPRPRPLVGIALPFMLGVACGLSVSIPAWIPVAAAVLFAGLSFAWLGRRALSVAALAALLFALGAGHARMEAEARWRPGAVAPRLAHRMEYVRFAAVARDDAVRRPPRPGRRAGDVCVGASAVALNRDGRWERVDEPVEVVLRGVPDDALLPLYGERWAFHGLVRPGRLRGGGTQAIVDYDRAAFWDAGHGNPLVRWCMERRRACRRILSLGLGDRPEERAILQALLLGYRADLPETLRDDFRSTGTIHIFAISGAHVALVTGLIAAVLRLFFVPRVRWFWFAAPLVAAYTVGTGAAVSAVRACLMAVAAMGALCARRRPDGASSLLAAALAILAFAPSQLFDLGFILSFAAVASLLALVPVFERPVARLFARDPWGLPRKRPWPIRALLVPLGWAAGFLRGNAIVSCAAWIGTGPLTAYWFNLFSPIALAMNLVVIPTVGCILVCGVASLLGAWTGDAWPQLCNGAAAWLAGWLARCIAWAAEVPGGHWFVRSPPAALVWGGYAAMFGGVWAWRRGRRAAFPLALAAVAAAYALWGAFDARRCRVSVLDAGESNAVLVQAGRARVLVDTGEAFRAYPLLRKLRAQGVNRLDAIVLTHADNAHTGALPHVLDAVPTAEIWIPDPVWPAPAMRELLARAEGGDPVLPPVRRVSAGDSGLWPEGVSWEALWPAKNAPMTCADDASLVLRVARYGASVLLASDATPAAERALLARASPDAALLLAADHGAAASSPGWWLDAVAPDGILVSCGPHTKVRHPDAEFLDEIASRSLPLLRTDLDGDLHVDFAPAPVRWPERGWRVTAAHPRDETPY